MNDPSNPSRRLFLKKSLLTSAFLATASLAGCAETLVRRAPTDLKVFNAKEFAVLTAFLDRLLPASEHQPGALALGIPARFDAEIAQWSIPYQRQLKQAVGVFEDFSLVLSGMWGPFTRMTPEQQDRYLQNWMESGLDLKRQTFMAIKSLAVFLYYCQDQTWAPTGYPGPFDPRYRRPAYDKLEQAIDT